jgi:hypothetical protein
MTSFRIEHPTPKPADPSGIVSWVHFGDWHITPRPDQNYRDFASLIEKMNRIQLNSPSFAYLPGDTADHGRVEEYARVRGGPDQLDLPWIAQAMVNTDRLPDEVDRLTSHGTDENGKSAEDTIRVLMKRSSSRFLLATRLAGGNGNAIGTWPEHGILDTRLGPNKNGRH